MIKGPICVIDVSGPDVSDLQLFFLSLSPSLSPSTSEQTPPPEGLHAGGIHSDWSRWLLVCLHPEPLLEGPHEEDDGGPGGS